MKLSKVHLYCCAFVMNNTAKIALHYFFVTLNPENYVEVKSVKK